MKIKTYEHHYPFSPVAYCAALQSRAHLDDVARRGERRTAVKPGEGRRGHRSLGYLQPFPLSNSPQTYYLLYFTTSLQKIPPYNSSPTIPPISMPSIYYHSLTNYLFIVF